MPFRHMQSSPDFAGVPNSGASVACIATKRTPHVRDEFIYSRRGRSHTVAHVRFAPKATEVLRCRELTGRAPVVSHALPAKKHPYSIIASVPAIRGTVRFL